MAAFFNEFFELWGNGGEYGGIKNRNWLYNSFITVMLGGADGTRTRDPRRDRPIF